MLDFSDNQSKRIDVGDVVKIWFEKEMEDVLWVVLDVLEGVDENGVEDDIMTLRSLDEFGAVGERMVCRLRSMLRLVRKGNKKDITERHYATPCRREKEDDLMIGPDD
jgi:hypothetical protein